MVMPHGTTFDIEQRAVRDSGPQSAQNTATPSRDIRLPSSHPAGRMQGTGMSFDPALKTFGPPAHGVSLDLGHALPHFDMSLPDTDEYFTAPSKMTNPSYSDLSQDFFSCLQPSRDGSASSQDGGDGGSSTSSPPPDIFSARTSAEYLQYDLFPNPLDSGRSHSRPLGPYTQSLYGANHGNFILPLPGAQSWDESLAMYRALDNFWGVLPSPRLPGISQTSRCGVSQLSQSDLPLFSAFGRYPTLEDLRCWPQIFSRGMKTAPKKQTLACHFCRDRKIGCTRPDEDDPDQTCNQCARRKRRCEYPTESRRGQHVRRRTKKSNLSTVIPPSLTTL
ncbi:hypothetical protein FB451DRAFT_1507884 [Mycena latifolia]|nr:hypothetical protein FB451DRAFT_1507884 [Mycena latifolia]